MWRSMSKLFFLSSFIFVSVLQPAIANEWTLLYKEDAKDGEVTSHYIDQSTKKKRGNIVWAWILTDYSSQRLVKTSEGMLTYSSGTSHVYVNCKTRESATAIDRLYSEPMGRGELLGEQILAKDFENLHWNNPDIWAFPRQQSDHLCK